MLSLEILEELLGSGSEHSGKLEKLERLGRRFLSDGASRGVTALKTEVEIRSEFLLDSLGAVPALPARGRVLDIGTGGGVPGLVLAIARPDLDFVLTDSAQKKTAWVSELVVELELANVEVVTRRLELLGREPEFRERFEAVTAKALASLNVLCEFALPFLKVGGRLLAFKGPALPQEIEQARFALSELGAEVHRCSSYQLGEKQTILCEILKKTPTEERFPRRDGLPQKKPLLNSRKR